MVGISPPSADDMCDQCISFTISYCIGTGPSASVSATTNTDGMVSRAEFEELKNIHPHIINIHGPDLNTLLDMYRTLGRFPTQDKAPIPVDYKVGTKGFQPKDGEEISAIANELTIAGNTHSYSTLGYVILGVHDLGWPIPYTAKQAKQYENQVTHS
jgi:hypothetical protein